MIAPVTVAPRKRGEHDTGEGRLVNRRNEAGLARLVTQLHEHPQSRFGSKVAGKRLATQSFGDEGRIFEFLEQLLDTRPFLLASPPTMERLHLPLARRV